MKKITLSITGMHCATCALNIESALRKVPGVVNARVNIAIEKAYIEFEPDTLSPQDLLIVIEKTGFKAFLPEESMDSEGRVRNREVRDLGVRFVIAITLSVVLMFVPAKTNWGHGLQLLLATGVLLCGLNFFRRGFFSVIRLGRASMDTLVALGVGSAYAYSFVISLAVWYGRKTAFHDVYYEVAAFLLSFILLGRYLESLTKRRTSQAIKKLMNLRPKTAYVIRDGIEREVPIIEVVVGDLIVVKPGQRIPVDGEIIEGYSSVDESMITGESIPTEKSIGSCVVGGTINKGGSFTFRATKVGHETTLAHIIRLIEEAQESKAPVQQVADTVAAYFVPAVLLIAVISFGAWFLAGKGVLFALTACIAVLIVACPCSLGLATPTAVMVGTGVAAENGIIIKNAASLQTARKLDTIVFDKTGTLTSGKPRVTDIVPVGVENSEDVLRIAAIAEKRSEHRLAEAIMQAAHEKGYEIPDPDLFNSVTGKGVVARYKMDKILLGNRRLFEDIKIDVRHFEPRFVELEAQGKTVVIVGYRNEVYGIIAVADTLKDFAKETVHALRKMRKEVILITGDNLITAQAIAKEVGIDTVLAEVLPQDKALEIKKLQAKKRIVAMVGDGINDAPALAQADIGIAIGTGTDVAIETGDIILIKDDIRDVVFSIQLSAFTMRKIKQNLFWAFVYNGISIPAAAGLLYSITGHLLSPVIAGGAMALSSISVVLNSLSMRFFRKRL
ncbi:MAG TPA: heavy metal translocating P-type ATPase [Candidatus Omnitrophota bacterium]|nr:heavy metal translocating P-type ATPase [Candidatus Omnitrophota bacterium]HPT07881.1 heavy metal translocating P-type ATPase [Candidatus Omnitrophota bacterium]